MKDIILTRDIVGREPDQRILDFIEEFNKAAGDSAAMFSNGYCYHFAAMLASVFEGQIMWPLGVSHMVFMSEDLVPYDRYGQNDSECEAFISLRLMESDSLYGFKYKDNRPHNFMADLVTLARIDQQVPGLTHKVIPMITANLPGFETLTPEEALQKVKTLDAPRYPCTSCKEFEQTVCMACKDIEEYRAEVSRIKMAYGPKVADCVDSVAKTSAEMHYTIKRTKMMLSYLERAMRSYTLDMFLKDAPTLIQVMEKHPKAYQQWFTDNFPNGASSREEVLNKLKED